MFKAENVNLNSKKNTERERKKGRIKREERKKSVLIYEGTPPIFIIQTIPTLADIHYASLMHIYALLKSALNTKCIICDHGNNHI